MATFLQDSGWEFVTSKGRDASAGVTLFLGISASQGSLYVAPHLAKDNPYELKFRSVGGSASIGLPPASYDVATKDMESAGVIYANPLRISEAILTLDDLTGPYLAYSISYSGLSTLEGRSWTVMFIGVGLGLIAAFPLTCSGIGAPLGPAAVISSCHASVWFWGDLIGTPGAGVTGSLGYITTPPKPPKEYPVDQMAG